MQPTRVLIALIALIASLQLSACAASREAALQQDNAQLRLQLQQARDLARANKLSCEALERDNALALTSARQLRADTQYLRDSTGKLSDAVTRLSYEDWNKVVPEVQLHFSDVEAASNDLDSRVGRVLIALHADENK